MIDENDSRDTQTRKETEDSGKYPMERGNPTPTQRFISFRDNQIAICWFSLRAYSPYSRPKEPESKPSTKEGNVALARSTSDSPEERYA